MTVTKRDGSQEELNIRKIKRSLEWSANGLNVDIDKVITEANLQLTEGIKTSEIHEIMIQVANDLSSLRYIDYDAMSARLMIQKIHHEAFSQTEPLKLYDIIKRNIRLGKYNPGLIEKYSKEEIDNFGQLTEYNRNLTFSKAGIQTMYDNYMIHVDGKTIEDPQTMYMSIAMDVFMNYKGSNRLEMVLKLYDALSKFEISLPTPMMMKLRTPMTDYASCCTINIGDSIDSWT
jgi:ribonucleoside-diphosphate reductase alpha chain